MELILKKVTDLQEYEVDMKGSNVDGTIANNLSADGFAFKPSEYCGALSSDDLRIVADKLDELNKTLSGIENP